MADAPPEIDALSNKMLGEFRILRRLGHGGMAEVYLAEQTSLQRNVAIKVLRKELVQNETYLKRFKTEAMAAAGLSHPNIVRVFMIGEEGGRHYIVQEYVQGLNLREFLGRKGPPDLNVALHTMKQVASALQAASNAGIVHRDIKPENIMITRKGEVKVTDFGLAQLTQGGERLNLTQEGVTMGTPLYMSPEQVSGSSVDQRSDIYSFGVTYYHVLTGAPPFRGDTALSVAVQHLKKAPEPLENLRPDLPKAFCKIIHRMMAKDVDQRYPNAQAVLKDLKRIPQERAVDPPEEQASEATHDGGTARRSSAGGLRGLPYAMWKKTDRPPRRQVAPFLITALLVASAGAGAGWLLRTANPLQAAGPVKPHVHLKNSAAEQFYYALSLKDNEEAWKAVIANFPEELSLKYRAEQELASIYLRHGRFDEALALFDRLAALSDLEKESRAFGLAGQASIYSLRGDYRDSQQVLDTLKPLYGLLDDHMKYLANETIRRNQRGLNGKEEKEWKEIFKHDEQNHGEPNAAEQTGE